MFMYANQIPILDLAHVNVLVSNDNTFFSFVENPLNAHTTYGENDAVKKLVVCGAVNGAAAC